MDKKNKPEHISDDKVALATELEEIKRLNEELRQARERDKLASIGELSGDLIHRMNSPLSAIRANIQFIYLNRGEVLKKDDYLDEKIAEILRITESAMKLIQEMKEKARATLLQSTDLASAVKESLEGIQFPESITFNNRIEKQKNIPNIIAGEGLSKVFRNLVINAIQAMPTGGTLTLYAELSDQDWINIIVEDTGIGIPAEWNDEIFNILSVFSKNALDYGGHGLGLWYSRAYIEACGGEMPPPVSVVGKGTRFMVRLRTVK